MQDATTCSSKLGEPAQFAGAVKASLHFTHGAADAPCSGVSASLTPFTRRAPSISTSRGQTSPTLYMQSAAGGLYRGDHVALSITV